ncbi:protocadherin Fat 4-like [Lepisosteus oculatus]|uniref:protocadherin Fat 4-like n=1 Tax=Lepisosteus oculatus TaxID=7918 RepID=UPI0035F52AA7
MRIASEAGKQYFNVDLSKGELVVIEKIDREYLCGQKASCLLPLEIIIETPLQLYRVEVEIQDINDNAPGFQTMEHVLNIGEHVAPGARFPLESAQDPDVGSNALSSYLLNPNDFFSLNIKSHDDGTKVPELILKKALDRETKAALHLTLTAVDGGKPARSGTTEIIVQVLDTNDNAPRFEKPVYKIALSENTSKGTVAVEVKAKDLDEGPNGEIQYSFGDHTQETVQKLFEVNSLTGEIVVKGQIDYELSKSYKFDVRAIDNGNPKMEEHCTVHVEITDINDNAPEIVFTSLPSPVLENATIGTVVALISTKDLDSGENGNVNLQLPSGNPFKLKSSFSNHYALVTDASLDREMFPEYNIEIFAIDSGSPPLSTKKTVTVSVVDVNDNPPRFSQPFYSVYVKENSAPGAVLCSVSASDPDLGENAKVSYTILDSKVQDVSISSYVYINSDNGSIYSMQSFDYEKLKVFQIQVKATDKGSPSESSNVTVHVFILDQNDNVPAVIYPSADMGSLPHQKMPRSAKAGHLVTKVTAVDADSGHNAWISYKLVEATDNTLFSVNLHTGEVRTKRRVSEQDDSTQRLVIEMKDNGEPVQSATVTIDISLEDGVHEPILDFRQKSKEPDKNSSKITFYLILALASVSTISFLTFVILAVKCVRNSRGAACCCVKRADKNPQRNLQLQLNTDGPIKYIEVLGGDMLSQSQSFRSCFSPMSEISDFTFVKPSSTTDFKEIINVLDASLPDNSWSFESQQIRYAIPEELKEGSAVGNIANDLGLNVGEMSDRKLRIASEDGKQYFNVDMEKGELVVSENIDRESLCGQSSCLLPLEIIIEEPLQLYRVEVEIQDINDNSPKFSKSENVLNVAESTMPGVTFPLETAQDPDAGTNSLRSYNLNKNPNFALNVKTNKDGTKVPELILQKALDREKQPIHQLVLTAVDGGNPAKSGTTLITVKVLDINDNAPVFDNALYETRLKEDTPNGTVVVTVKAIDLDEGQNGEIVYSFGTHTSEAVRNLFHINPHTGEITVNDQLDYETRTSYKFDVRATDKGVPAIEGHSSVQVDVLDVNDNAPEIIITSFPKPIREDAPIGTVVALISVKDIDSEDNAKVTLTLPSECPFKLKPSFSNHYTLVTDSQLDREEFPEYNIKIEASDSGSPPLSSSKVITVRILDVNDNPPRFSQSSYTVYVKENDPPGLILCSVSASDPDIGENSEISYSMLDTKVQDVSVTSYIYINSANGSIYSMHSFDYEKIKMFQIQVQANDKGSPSKSSNVTVHVFILDQNDNVPAVIYPSADMGSLPHQKMPRSAKAGHLVTKVTAVDADSGHNAWISYKLVEATDDTLFSVNLYTGEVRTKRGVSEQDDSIQRLVIEMKDNGEPVQTATVTIDISLEDGVHEPILDFRQKSKEPDKKSSKITFYLILALASVSAVSFLTFVILAVKCVRNSRGAACCCVKRADKNPQRNLQLQLNTDGPIKYIEVLGGDMLSQSQSFRSCFSPMSEISDFTFVKPSSTTDFKEIINVLDASLPDNSWSFESQQIRYTIPEELNEGSIVGNIAKDLGLQIAEISDRKLRIASEAGKQYFSVDWGKGELVVSETIDRENLCGQSASCLIPLEVIIESPLQLYRVEVEIQDINDNTPSFVTTEQVLNIAESTAPGARFPLKNARDPDVGTNAMSSYRINKNGNFVLNVKTNKDGAKVPELILEKALDRENEPVIQLVLMAIDGGNPARSGTTQITIHVLDINDNAPHFEKALYETPVQENSPKGTVITAFKAVDLDEGSNGDVLYSFADHTAHKILNTFNINAETGELVIIDQIDYEESSSFEFDVRATDKGTPAMETHCSVHVEILDVNDNAPEIVLTSLPSPVREDASVGTVVALITAKDLDSGDNGKVNVLVSPGYPFKLKPSFANHYALVTDSSLDRETFPEYNIEIQASDSGSPSLRTQKIITVNILDVNDNAPVFSKASYTAYVKENATPGKILYSVSASDSDLGENAKVSYSILDTKVQDISLSSYIYINSDNGSIYSMHSFDYEKLKVFQIQVQAKDQGSPPLSSNATVHVFILDQNDNVPAVIYPSADMGSLPHQKMPRSAKAGHLVTKVTAVDADSGHNAWISYKLVEATDDSLFSVNLHTGEVRTKRGVSEQDDSIQRLVIEMKDNGEPVQSATVTIDISLEDGVHEPILDFRQKSKEPDKKSSKITFYLILALASVSAISFLTFVILAVKCVRNSRGAACCCVKRADKNPQRNLQLQLNTDGPIKYIEVLGGDMLSQSQSFRSCFSPMSEISDFTFVKPSSTTDFQEIINVLDASLPDNAWTFESQQVRIL